MNRRYFHPTDKRNPCLVSFTLFELQKDMIDKYLYLAQYAVDAWDKLIFHCDFLRHEMS